MEGQRVTAQVPEDFYGSEEGTPRSGDLDHLLSTLHQGQEGSQMSAASMPYSRLLQFIQVPTFIQMDRAVNGENPRYGQPTSG